MKDIDRVIEILENIQSQCRSSYRHGDGLTHSATGQVDRDMEQAIAMLREWPAKVYAVGVEPKELLRDE